MTREQELVQEAFNRYEKKNGCSFLNTCANKILFVNRVSREYASRMRGANFDAPHPLHPFIDITSIETLTDEQVQDYSSNLKIYVKFQYGNNHVDKYGRDSGGRLYYEDEGGIVVRIPKESIDNGSRC